jgi:predicted GIY-YIG superfamily endonuclease
LKKVYLLQSKENGLYKIGTSKDPNRRVKQLQTGSGETLYLLHEYESKYATIIEKAFHSTYSYTRKEGEWFDLDIFAALDFPATCSKIEKNIEIIKTKNL